jgi:hypothetical protein
MRKADDRHADNNPRPLSEYQADLRQFYDAVTRVKTVQITVPWGNVYFRQAPGGQAGQDYDVLRINNSGGMIERCEMDRAELRSFVEGCWYHDSKIARGAWGDLVPARFAKGRGGR